jgi:hypothetical protein
MRSHLADPVAKAPHVSRVSVLHRFWTRKNSSEASTITEVSDPVIEDRRRLELMRCRSVSVRIRIIKTVAEYRCGPRPTFGRRAAHSESRTKPGL